MSDKNVHVTPHDGRWAVDREGSRRVSSVHDTQAEAEAAGRATARREQVTFVLRRPVRGQRSVHRRPPDPQLPSNLPPRNTIRNEPPDQRPILHRDHPTNLSGWPRFRPSLWPRFQASSTALVLDVDGVVSPVPGPTDWGDDLSAGEFFGPVMTSPELCRRLDRVGQQPGVIGLWLTSWHAQTRAGMSLFPGRDWLHFDPDGYVAESDESGWWKADALLGWIEQQPAISRLVWVDDHLARPHDSAFDVLVDGVETRADRLTSILAARGVRATLIAPATAIGLTREHMSQIEQVVLDEFGPDGR